MSTHGGIGELDVKLKLTDVVEVAGVRAFAARTTSYQYIVSDIAGQELVIYDWHPSGRSPVTTLHLHFPTGPVGTAPVVEMLIQEFGVNPIRRDWDRVLGSGAAS